MDDDKRIGIVASFKAKEGQESALLKACLEVAVETRAEDGCLMYELHLDAKDPSTIVLFERWASDAFLKKHLETPHAQKFLKAAGAMFAAPPSIQRLRPQTA